MDIGARILEPGQVYFKVWAPNTKTVSVKLVSETNGRSVALKKGRHGYFSGAIENVHDGDRYLYVLADGRECPDPVSRFQPEGVHNPSQIVDSSLFSWEDKGWEGVALKDFIIYEIHVATFTNEGTFRSIISYIDYLKELGITAIELMPVAQFPGARNWGYDGVFPFAPHNTYGGPSGLKALVNACHKAGLSVILDVVYNHLGPEGNYLGQFGPYFTDRYKTPWGDAVNYDGPYSDEVRNYFISNALYWVVEYHVDALRADAIHGIYDFSACHILEEIGEAVHAEAERQGRNIFVIPESDLNDVRVINPRSAGGFGMDAQWNDDFHHALHTLVTGERDGYYRDFGSLHHLAKAFKEGFVYSGQYSRFRRRRHGNSSSGRASQQFIVFSQNHDQVGNRAHGDRLSATASPEQLKLAAAVVLLSPFIPLLFMGEECGEKTPFCYFVDHADKELIEAVRKGRRDEFARFGWEKEPPDPQAEETFLASRIRIEEESKTRGSLLEFYRSLIALRKDIRAAGLLSKRVPDVGIFRKEKVLLVADYSHNEGIFCLFSFSEKTTNIDFTPPAGHWYKALDTSLPCRGGNGRETAPSRILSDGSGSRVTIDQWSAVAYRQSGLEN